MLPMPRQYGIGRRAPALRALATSYDFKETWFIDVSSCTPPRPGRGYDLVDFGSTSVDDLIHLFNHELLTHARRHVARLCTAMSRTIQPELPLYYSMPQPHQHGPSSEYRNSETTNHSSDAKNSSPSSSRRRWSPRTQAPESDSPVLNSPVLESPSLLHWSRHSAPSTCFNSSALDASDRPKLDQSPLGTSTQSVHPPGGFRLLSFADDHGPQN